ncbi:MAG TPA: phage portal protein [Chloroflexota bacterium]|nr:phage portal protein [Chloroflexota bacterium]
MSLFAEALARITHLAPERKVNVGALVPAWEEGKPQNPRYWHNYYRFALEGYSRNEIVFACVEELATSAAEPKLRVMRKGANGKAEEVPNHPLLDLFEAPNPFMSRYQLIATLVMFRAVAGNAYLEKTRSAAGKVVQLWPLRPDRVFVLPDRQKHIGGWEYRLEGEVFSLAATQVIQTRTRNALDDYYGLPPLAVCAERVDTDSMMRAFTLAFFRNAGVPAGLLNITKQVTTAERQIIRDKIRGETGGPQNWHQMLVLDNTEASYTPMGMPLGASGIVLPELDEISEARLAMAFGIPLEVIGARLGMIHGNRSTMEAARGSLWDETLIPLYQELAADLSRGMKPEYDDTADEFDFLEFDLSTVKALQEDEDAKHDRVRKDVEAGILSVQEARAILGHEQEYEKDALLMLGSRIQPMLAAAAVEGAPAQQAGGDTVSDPAAPPPAAAGPAGKGGNGHGPLTPDQLDALKEFAKGRS